MYMMPAKVELGEERAVQEPTKNEVHDRQLSKPEAVEHQKQCEQPMKIEMTSGVTQGASTQEQVSSPAANDVDATCFPSRGSASHGTGDCRPCAWFWKSVGCKNNSNCQHCHICPESELKARKKQKLTMMRLGLATPKSQVATSPSHEPVTPPTVKEEEDPISTPSAAVNDFGMGCDTRDPLGVNPDASGSDVDGTTGAGSQDSTAFPCSREESCEDGSGGSASDEAAAVAPTSLLLPGVADAKKVAYFANAHGDTQAYYPPGLEPQIGVPSAGSYLHESGQCNPCAWKWKAAGCQNGQNCIFCHLCPEGELKMRKKTKMAMMRLGLATPKFSEPSPTATSPFTEMHDGTKFPLILAECV